MTTANTQPIPAGYRRDARDRLVPIEQIKDIDLARDQVVTDVITQVLALANQVAAFKRHALDELDAFVDLSSEQYGVDLGGKRGGVTLTSFDGQYRIIRAISDTIDFDERLKAAEALISECLDEWSRDARAELRTVVQDAFRADSKGKIATHKILSLRRIKIEDPKWGRAMEAISDAINVVSTKTYIRFYRRDSSGKYQQIPLDPTEL